MTDRPQASISADIPAELVEQIARGNCVLLLGPEVDSRDGFDDLARRLADECDYPPSKTDRSLPAVARYYQAMTNRQRLVLRLREWLERTGSEPMPLHRAVAGLPVNRIVDFGYDDRLAAALHRAGKPSVLVIRDHELPYADRIKVLLLKPCGTADQPDSLVLTDDDQILFVQNHPLLTDQLHLWAATQVLLWIGMDPVDPHWARLHRILTEGISPRHRREYALASDSQDREAWTEQGVTVLTAPDPATWLDQVAQAVVQLPPLPADELPGPGPLLGRRPYKFLDYYTAADADLFFGREVWASDLAARILAQPLTVLFGQSGVGKTSLLLAGVVPRLEARDCWCVYARPGEDPQVALRAAAEEKLDEADRAALVEMAELGSFFQAAGERLGKTPVVILDQAEECFTALARPLRERWVAALAQALCGTASNTRWVLSLREDFAAELHEWTVQVPALFEHTQRLTPLSRNEAHEAIARPPHRVGAVIEEALVDRLLDNLALDDVAPAQLQIVCDRLYQGRDQAGRMTLATYEALGGTGRILAEYVDDCLARLPREQQEMAVALLKAMVTGRETKLPLRPEVILGEVVGDPAEKQLVLDGLVDARLVRSLEYGVERRYELAHEVLVDKVRTWIDETEHKARVARDLLHQGRTSWERLQVLPEREKVAYLHEQRENPYLHLDEHDLQLMLRAALHEGLAPGYWTRRAAEAELEVWPVLAAALESAEEQERIHAQWALAGWPVLRALEVLRAGLAVPSPRVRVAAHQALYHIGSSQALDILDGSDDLRLVPAGEFTMGKDSAAHDVNLDAFFVEKYPVTNQQYAEFIEAGAYEARELWTRAGWQLLQRTGRAQPQYWRYEKWNQPDHPVVGISWYEAAAYARWAGRRLLTEAEWEKAARGSDGREYPWGIEFDQECCNTSESGLERTTPVGHYSPLGDSPYGCADMAGNVNEWTSSLYRSYPYRADDGREEPNTPGNRVLRGGGWWSSRGLVYCAARHDHPPNLGSTSHGCRCAVGAVSSSFSPPTGCWGNSKGELWSR